MADVIVEVLARALDCIDHPPATELDEIALFGVVLPEWRRLAVEAGADVENVWRPTVTALPVIIASEDWHPSPDNICGGALHPLYEAPRCPDCGSALDVFGALMLGQSRDGRDRREIPHGLSCDCGYVFYFEDCAAVPGAAEGVSALTARVDRMIASCERQSAAIKALLEQQP